MDYKNWRHVFKIDPAKEISDESLEKICESGTDVILVGGTDGVTIDNVIDKLVRIRRFTVPVALEISNIESVTPGFDYYLIPSVLNSTETKWVKDLHHEAIKEYGDILVWDELIAEGYCVLNSECKVAKETNAQTDLTEEDVIAYARLAESYFKFPIFYLEYSGTYGDPKIVSAVKSVVNNARVFYGGGISSPEQASEMAKIADTIIVGNIIYENLNQALKTVNAVKSISI